MIPNKTIFPEHASHCEVVLGRSRESEGGREARLRWQGELEVRIPAALAELCRTGCTAGHEQVVHWQDCGVTGWGQQVLPVRIETHKSISSISCAPIALTCGFFFFFFFSLFCFLEEGYNSFGEGQLCYLRF